MTVIRNGDHRDYYFSYTQNWLSACANLKGTEVLTIHPLGHLTWKLCLEAIVAQYGTGEFEVVQHGSALHVQRHFRKR